MQTKSFYEFLRITPDQHEERYWLYNLWQQARLTQNFALADLYREQYREWDVLLGHPSTWVECFESTDHRTKRIQAQLHAAKTAI